MVFNRIYLFVLGACLFLMACDAWYFIDFENNSGQDLIFKCFYKKRKPIEIDTFAYRLPGSKKIHAAQYLRSIGRDSILYELDSIQKLKYLNSKSGLKIIRLKKEPAYARKNAWGKAYQDSSAWRDTVEYVPLPNKTRWTSIASHLGKKPYRKDDNYSYDIVRFLTSHHTNYVDFSNRVDVLNKDSVYKFSLMPYNSPVGMPWHSEGDQSYKIEFTPEHVK
jgi:hypothetical protein